MPREAIVQGGGGEEQQRDFALRPKLLREVVGQKDVARRLQIAVNAARILKELLEQISLPEKP